MSYLSAVIIPIMANSKLIYAFSFLLIWGRVSYSQDDGYGFLTDEDFAATQLFTIEDFILILTSFSEAMIPMSLKGT